MKKKLLSIISLLLLNCVLFAEDYHVKVTQNVQIPGGQYALDMPAPPITWTSLPNGKLNLRYNFALDAEKDDKSSLIDCKIEISSGVSYLVTSFDGLQSFEFDGEQVPALVEHTTYAEFFLPVRKNGDGFIEIQLSIPYNCVGSDIPIKITFNRYERKTNVAEFVSLFGIIYARTSILGGIILSNDTASYATNRERNPVKIEEKFKVIKDNFVRFPLLDSLKHYRVQVR